MGDSWGICALYILLGGDACHKSLVGSIHHMRRILIVGFWAVVCVLLLLGVVVLIQLALPITELDLEIRARQLAGPYAKDCGSNHGNSLPYPSADACAAATFKAGKPFRAHACFWMTDTAGCYRIVGTPTGEVYFFLYTLYTLSGDTAHKPYGCENCRTDNPVVAQCDSPVIIYKGGTVALRCPSFPSEWLDHFHIAY